MDSSGLLSRFRQDMDDLSEPYLWTDEEIFEYANDAQIQFCRLTEGIADSRTASICQFATVDAQEWYTLSPKILKLRSATRGDTGRNLHIVNPEKLNLWEVRFDGRSAPLSALVVGLTDGAVRAYPVPNEAVTVNLSVFRLPLLDITDADQALEIAPQHHTHLVLWMRHRGYLKQDADTFNEKLADDFEARFKAYCFKALAEQERARRQVGVTAYGGL